MPVSTDEVATSIETHVRETIDRMVGEIRSSIEDVRKAVDSQLDAALQSVQADVNSISFRPHLQRSIGELEESIQSQIPPASGLSSGEDGARVKRAIQAVESGKTQVDVLNALLDQCLQFGSRAALLIVKGDSFSGWKGTGFTATGGSDDQVKRFAGAGSSVASLSELLRDEHVVASEDGTFAQRVGASAPARSVFIPMVIKDKVAAAVYVDVLPGDEEKFAQSSLELLVYTTGLLIDTLAIRKKVPSPSLSSEAGAAASPPAPARVARVESMPAPPPPPASIPPAPASTPEDELAPDATVAISMQSLRFDVPPPAPRAPAFERQDDPASSPTSDWAASPPTTSFDISGSGAFSAPPPPPPPPPPPAPAPVEPNIRPAAPTSGTEPGERPSTQFIPPPGLVGGRFSGPTNDETRKHDEARRFARLLVSEIKLYNEPKVDQGRRNRDLYERMKEDIDRSRQMYDERIPEEVRTGTNYFYDELVRILADGNADALGL